MIKGLLTKLSARAPRTDRIDFLICGARRSGTTSLEYCLQEHPEVGFLNVRDLDVIGGVDEGLPFNRPFDFRFSGARYGAEAAAQYDAVVGGLSDRPPCIGWRVVYSMWFPHMIFNIAEQLPDVKLLFSLRNPIDTAYSVYARRWARGDQRSFEEVVGFDPNRRPDAIVPSSVSQILQRGFYEPSIRLFHRVFPAEQIHVYPFDEMVARPAETMRGVVRFLGLDEEFEFSRLGTVKSASTKPAPMNPDTRAWLGELYAPHNRRLFTMLGWPLDLWD